MAWTYIQNMDEYDKEVQKDSSTSNRYTFNRYLYFKPTQYDSWAKGQNYSGVPYTAELVGNANIPSGGTHLTGSLSAFYVSDVVSIKNLSEEDHGDACSYAVVTVEYENKPKSQSGGGGSGESGSSSAQDAPNKPPWQRAVEDFTVTNQEISIPLTEAYEYGENDIVPVATTAGQVLYGFTASLWIQRLTWTFNTKSGDYSMAAPLINDTSVTLFGKVTIPASEGLLLPPGYKRLYYTDQKNGYENEPYDQWTFEIIHNSMGFDIPVLNAGTKAIIDGNLVDICTWYVYDPNGQDPVKEFGTFAEMMEAKMDVDEYNKNITDETQKKVWHGDYVQSPVPITEQGEIDTAAIDDPMSTYRRYYAQYEEGTWSLGGV